MTAKSERTPKTKPQNKAQQETPSQMEQHATTSNEQTTAELIAQPRPPFDLHIFHGPNLKVFSTLGHAKEEKDEVVLLL